jgi:3-oxoacid CoA-transferase subunit A
MIKKWLVCGDQHGSYQYLLENLKSFYDLYKPEELGIIALGDFGLNFYLNKTDEKKKAMLNNRGYKFYLVRGNHEARPEDLPNIKMIYDDEIDGAIYIEAEYPNIRYLVDGACYCFGKYKCLILGGAYSVDKEYRLLNHYPWFENEQLTEKEKAEILHLHDGNTYDFIFSHTCPISWEPRDLFLPMIDQSKVDKSMENFLDEIKDNCDWGAWAFGHFHASRRERSHVYQFYEAFMPLSSLKD